MNSDLFEKFADKIETIPEDGCWIWIGARMSTGYGMLMTGCGATLAHRLSYEHYISPLNKDDLVLHTCDRRTCVNPAHLFVGSHKDNTQDMLAKGRNDYKYTQALKDEIKAAYETGEWQQKQLAERFGVSRTHVNRIVRNVRT